MVDQRWRKGDGSHTDRFAYGYDRNSNRLYRQNLVDAAFSELYHANGASEGYDLLNQLTAFRRGVLSDSNSDGIPDTVASASRSQGWDLDALGNWSTLTTDGTPESRSHNRQNQVTAVGSTNLTFDNNGNLTTDPTGKTLVYDAWNRLVKVKDGATTLVAYMHDALSRRMTEDRSGTVTDLYYSAAWQVLEERVGGTAKIQYVWSPVYVDALVLRDRDANGQSGDGLEERLYVQQDANWNVTALVDAAGNVVERYVYDPYGQPVVLNAFGVSLSLSAYSWQYRWQGLRFQEGTSLYHARHREISATLGRPIQRDPIEFKAGDPNLYRWEGNSPTNLVDPSGEFPWVFAIIAVAVMGAGAGGVYVGYTSKQEPSITGGFLPGYGPGRTSGAAFANGQPVKGVFFALLIPVDALTMGSLGSGCVRVAVTQGARGFLPGAFRVAVIDVPPEAASRVSGRALPHWAWSTGDDIFIHGGADPAAKLQGRALWPLFDQRIRLVGDSRYLPSDLAEYELLLLAEARRYPLLPVLNRGLPRLTGGDLAFGGRATDCYTATLRAWSRGNYHLVPYLGSHGGLDLAFGRYGRGPVALGQDGLMPNGLAGLRGPEVFALTLVGRDEVADPEPYVDPVSPSRASVLAWEAWRNRNRQ